MLLFTLAVLVACVREPHVVVKTAAGPVRVNVEVANTPQSRELGLMYRRDMAADAGMLFIFPGESRQAFWMKNTPLSLDMIFIDAAHKIVGIVPDARPFSTKSLGVSTPSKYVLEVHAGFCTQHGIAAGDQIELADVADSAR